MWDNMLVSYISFHKETWYFELSNNKCNRGYYLIMWVAVHQGGIWSPTTLSYKKKNIRSLTKISIPGLLLGLVCTYIVKAIFIYFTKNCDDITGTESQFSLSKKGEKSVKIVFNLPQSFTANKHSSKHPALRPWGHEFEMFLLPSPNHCDAS